VALYFAARGSLSDLWEQVFAYNFLYIRASIEERLSGLGYGLVLLVVAVVGLLAVAAWGSTLLGAAKGKHDSDAAGSLRRLALVALPVELLMVALSSRPYPHYYLALLPVASLLVAVGFADFVAALPCTSVLGLRLLRNVPPRVWAVLLVLLMSLTPYKVLAHQFGLAAEAMPPDDRTRMAAVEYIAAHTEPGDRVLMWGAETSVNYLSGRAAPSRFVYQVPFCTPDGKMAAAIDTFLLELQSQPPALIIDASASTEYAALPPLDAESRAAMAKAHPPCGPSGKLDGVFSYMSDRYTMTGPIGPLAWPVYTRK
jgi:hypothetical protein